MTSRRSIKVSLMLGLFLSLFSLLPEANAQVPRSISYQGQLRKSNAPYSGTVNMEIKIYDASGQELYTESYTGVTVNEGIFNVQIGGMDNHLPGYLKFDQQYFLGINVDGAGELSPRTPFVASPYALNSQTVGGVGVSTVPTPGMLLPLDANGKIPASVLPQAAQDVTTINGVTGDGAGNINLTSSNNSIAIVPNAATNSIDLTITSMPSGFDASNIVIGAGLGGGPVTPGSDTITIFIKSNGVTTDMLGTGVVTGIKLDQFVAGNGLYQDALGNLHIGYDATLQIVNDVLGINLSNPNTWLALQTFNAGITVNGTTTLNGPVITTGPVIINGTAEPNATLNPVGVSVFEEQLNGDLRVAGFSYLVGNTRIDGNTLLNGSNNTITGTVDAQNTISNTTANNGGAVYVGDDFHATNDVTLASAAGSNSQIGNATGSNTIDGNVNSINGNNNFINGQTDVTPGFGSTLNVNGNPFPAAANAAGQPTEWDLTDNGDLLVTGFSWLWGNTQVDMSLSVGGNTTVAGNTTLMGTLDAQGNIFNSTGDVTVGDNLHVTGNTDLDGTLNVDGLSTTNGINNTGTINQTGATNLTGNVTLVGNLTQTGNTSITGNLSNTGNVNLASNASTVNTFGGVNSANRFNGTSNFGTLPASNGNKVVIDGVVSNSAVPPPSTIPGSDYELVVNGDAQVTGYTNLNNAYVNNITIGGSIMFPPAATVCFNTLQVQNITSWCSGPAGAPINFGTAITQSSLGTSANNSFMATTVTGALTQSGGNANIAGGATNTFGNLAGTNAINGNTTVTGNLTVTGTTDLQNQVINSTGNDGGRVQVNDGFHVSGSTSNTTLDGDQNVFGQTGRGTTLVANPVAINPPTLNEATPNNSNSVRGHAQFIGTGAGLNERKIFVHGVPEGPGAVTPNNTFPPVTNFEVEIVGDLYVQGTIVGGGIPQIQSYTVFLVPGTGPNGGGSVTFLPAGGYDANDAVHMSYLTWGAANGILVYDSPGGNNVRIESSSALDNAALRVTVIRYTP